MGNTNIRTNQADERYQHIIDIQNRLKISCERGKGQRDMLLAQCEQTLADLNTTGQQIELLKQVQLLFVRSSAFAREQLKARLEEVVTAALQSVLERSDIRFEVLIREIGGRPAAEWQVVSVHDGLEVAANPEDGRGGGIVDIVSLALRLALLELSRPRPEGPILLDEPGKHVSAEYAPNLARFLARYAEQTGRQIIMVTHNDALADVAAASYRVTMENGQSEVQQI